MHDPMAVEASLGSPTTVVLDDEDRCSQPNGIRWSAAAGLKSRVRRLRASDVRTIRESNAHERFAGWWLGVEKKSETREPTRFVNDLAQTQTINKLS